MKNQKTYIWIILLAFGALINFISYIIYKHTISLIAGTTMLYFMFKEIDNYKKL